MVDEDGVSINPDQVVVFIELFTHTCISIQQGQWTYSLSDSDVNIQISWSFICFNQADGSIDF